MGNWLSELVRTNRLKSLEAESNRPAPWEGRTRAELIYGRERNDEEPYWPSREPAVMWQSHEDGTHTVRLRDSGPGGQETSSGQTGSVPDAPQGGATTPAMPQADGSIFAGGVEATPSRPASDQSINDATASIITESTIVSGSRIWLTTNRFIQGVQKYMQ